MPFRTVRGTVCPGDNVTQPIPLASGDGGPSRVDRRHPLESAPFLDADLPMGLKSKARVKAKEKADVHFHTNCGVSLVKQL